MTIKNKNSPPLFALTEAIGLFALMMALIKKPELNTPLS